MVLQAAAKVSPSADSYRADDDDEKSKHMMLRKAQTESRRRRKKISGTAGALGIVCILFGSTLGNLVDKWEEKDDNATRPPAAIVAGVKVLSLIAVCGIAILLLAVLPTDDRVILLVTRGLTVFFAAFVPLVGVRMVRHVHHGTCELEVVCGAWSVFFIGPLLVNFAVLVVRLAALLRHGVRGRPLLDRLWLAYGHWQLWLAYGPLCEIVVHATRGAWDRAAVGVIGVIVMVGLGGTVARPGFRMRAQSWLVSRGGMSVSTAAAIAALVGNTKIDAALEMAQTSFRCITLDKISREEMADRSPNLELYTRSTPARLGEVDAFLSHSWHDDADAKWDALCRYRDEFRSHHNREPKMWVDKLCIDQSNIVDSLLCLPIHLAGCRKLLVCAGATYTSRLWCCMELFVFLAAVNDTSRIEAVACPATATTSEVQQIAQSFARFRVQECQCFDPNERGKLLAIIEAGVGALEHFDSMIHRLGLCNEENKTAKKERLESADKEDYIAANAI